MALARSLSFSQSNLIASVRGSATTIALYAVIGIELMVLVTWMPDTLRTWSDPQTHGYGDFSVFFENAKSLSLTNMYSPALAVLLHPLTRLRMETAFAIYTGINVLALCGVAFIAQRAVSSLPAKVAVVLGVFALPQTHWALRVGHFTQVLALAALVGLLYSERRPVLAGVCIAVLALKPQYLAVPLLYLLVSKNWRAFSVAAGGLALLALAGVAAMALRDPAGVDMFGYTASYYGERAPELVRYLTVGQGDANYTHSWQYSWYGFLVSIDVDPNPAVAVLLTAVSAGGVAMAWKRCAPDVAKVAAALGMLLIVPHTTFYNWSMLSVAFALLLYADVRPRWLTPALIAMMVVAAAATQEATPWPLPLDRYRPADTLGVYWIQPAALAAIFALAIAGRPAAATANSKQQTANGPIGWVRGPGAHAHAPLRLAAPQAARMIAMAGMCCGALALGYAVSAYVSGSGPFRSDPYFGRAQVLSALPADFPAPPDAQLRDAGAGSRLPYRVEWTPEARTSDVAGIMRAQLDDGSWTIVAPPDDGDASTIDLRSTRQGEGGAPLVAEISIEPRARGSRVRLEFTPLPASSVPGYEDWLESIGLVVHDVDRELIDP